MILVNPGKATIGHVWIEDTPQEIDGQLYQTWREVLINSNTVTTEFTLPDLSAAQFAFLLAYTGLEDVWDNLEAGFKGVNPEYYATLKASRNRSYYSFKDTMQLVQTFTPYLPEGVDLSVEALTPLWLRASQF